MRRIVPLVLSAAALLSACDPTGNGAPTNLGHSHFRFANFVPDATGLSVSDNSGNIISNIQFTELSLYQTLSADSNVFTVTQISPSLTLGADTTSLIQDRRYTLYGLGKTTAYRNYLAVNDTVLAAAGQYKVRFIHGIESYSPFTLNFYDDTTSSLTGLTPTWPALSYVVGSLYIPVDTGVRRIRITKTGITTTILDTILPAIPSGAVVTLVATNVAGAGAGIQVTMVTDTTP